MGWERRGAHSYYYRKEREGPKVKSVYLGRGEIAHMISQIQSSSPLLERLARTIKSPDVLKEEKAEAALEQATAIAIAAYGVVVLRTQVLPAWLGWTTILFAVLSALSGLGGDALPLLIHVIPFVVGVVLLQRLKRIPDDG